MPEPSNTEQFGILEQTQTSSVSATMMPLQTHMVLSLAHVSVFKQAVIMPRTIYNNREPSAKYFLVSSDFRLVHNMSQLVRHVYASRPDAGIEHDMCVMCTHHVLMLE